MRRSFDTVVVGGGLFGKVISRALASQGQQVQCIDNHNGVRGSDPAACLMKPSWLTKLGPDLKPALELLDELYGVTDIDFQFGPVTTKVHWVDPAFILYPSLDPAYHSQGMVEGYEQVDGRWEVRWRDQDEWDEQVSTCTNIVIAAGIWSSTLVPQLRGRIDGRWGVAIRVPDCQIGQPFIAPWAPFKQLVGFNISPTEVWCGDGSAWKDCPTDERQETSVAREMKALGLNPADDAHRRGIKPLIGVRPYVKGLKDPCLLEEVNANVWVATGGAKNGTASAAWAANRLIERLT
jgi:glycine/D-amino acid oxidase-like deaminating enzyme